MLLIGVMSLIFILSLSIIQRRTLDRIIEAKVESANLLAQQVLQQTTDAYQKRIKGFVNYNSSKTKQQFIRAFASKDQAALLNLTQPFYHIFQNENPYFHSLAWILRDNTVFLRVQKPELSGDNISSFLPDVVEANRVQQQISGFGVAKIGMQYRIVEPVIYDGQHVGVVLFGIKTTLISDMLEKKLRVPSGLAIINEECNAAIKSERPALRTNTHTVRVRDEKIFTLLPENLDWNQPRHDFSKDGSHYVLLNILSLQNYADKYLGSYFIILDTTREHLATTRLIYAALAACTLFLLLSFFIIYSGYSSLVQKIINLNQSLEKNNLELEDRVRQRTAKLQESQQQLHRAQKMEAIGMMAGGVAHDLNNILTGITGYPELLLLQLPKDSKLRPSIEAINDSGKRAAAVVTDLLTVARGVAVSKVTANMNTLVREYFESPECKELRGTHQHIQYKLDLAEGLPNLSCSPIHIKKCIMNLVTNAAEATNRPGTVTISTTTVVPDQQWAEENGLPQVECIVLSVADTGSGIPRENLEHIFEPFYTKKVMGRSGTGLGLAVVWNTVEDHGGKIFVESSDKGTRFQLYFPASTQNDIIPPEDDVPHENIGNNERILVIDDEPVLRDITCQMLRALGYTVDSVSSGELAVEFLKDNPTDLLLIDMLMDPGMNGLETYKKALELSPGQKAIIISGFSENDAIETAIGLGAGAFIKKPYSMELLGRAVKKVLTGKTDQ